MSNVLIVDDFKTQRSYLDSICQELGLKTLFAASGEEALHILEQYPISVVLTDYEMPQMDGLTFISKVRMSPKHATVPIIMISSSDEAEEKAEKIGANVFIKKPVDKKEVSSAISNQLAERGQLRKFRVLLIDDVEMQTAIWSKSLHMENFVYDLAHSAQEGLNKLRANTYDAIITDYLMPNVDGIRFIKKVKSMPEFSKIPIFVISSNQQISSNPPEEVEKVFMKPFNFVEVKAALRNAVVK